MLSRQSDVIVNSLTVQFTKEVQVSFYKQMALTFGKLRDVEQKMNQILTSMGNHNDIPVSNLPLEFRTVVSDMEVALVDEERIRQGDNLSMKQFEIMNKSPPKNYDDYKSASSMGTMAMGTV